MDVMTVIQVVWPCIQERWPEIAGAALQVIGGASILFRALGAAGATPQSPTGIGSLLNMLGSIALDKTRSKTAPVN